MESDKTDKNENKAPAIEEATSPKNKQPYHKPQFSIYGDIKTLTQAIGGNSMVDGGMVGMLMSF